MDEHEPEVDAIQQEIEAAFVKAFIVKAKQDRFLYLLQSPKRRPRLLRELYHCPDIDPRWATPVEATGEPYMPLVAEALRRSGAPDNCQVLSTDARHDGRRMPLIDVLNEYHIGAAMLVVCIPGRLGCFIDEYGSAVVLKR